MTNKVDELNPDVSKQLNEAIEAALVQAMDYAFNKGLHNDRKPNVEKARSIRDKLKVFTADFITQEKTALLERVEREMPITQTFAESKGEEIFNDGWNMAVEDAESALQQIKEELK